MLENQGDIANSQNLQPLPSSGASRALKADEVRALT